MPTLADIKNDPKVMGAYLAYAKRRITLNEVLFFFDKGNAAGIYPKYLDKKSANAANVSSAVTDPAKVLADANDFANPKWAGIIQAGKIEVGQALQADVPTFLKSPEYKAYLRKEKMGDPSKAAKLLGIKDVKKLTAAMEEIAAGNKAVAERLFADLIKAEKMKQKAADVMKALEKSGLVG
jgi:hypothetical protein